MTTRIVRFDRAYFIQKPLHMDYFPTGGGGKHSVGLVREVSFNSKGEVTRFATPTTIYVQVKNG